MRLEVEGNKSHIKSRAKNVYKARVNLSDIQMHRLSILVQF